VSKRKKISPRDSYERPGWLEIAVETHPVAHEAFSAFFFDLGCEGVVSQSFSDRTFRAYLPLNRDSEDVRSRIELFLNRVEKIFPEARSSKTTFTTLPDMDWSDSWREYYRPLRITERLTVLPAWDSPPPSLQGILIRMDPGPAFGTGEHATTRMCLKAIEAFCSRPPRSLFDVGTGSGILAIYGAKLGAERVVALDNDPEALRWAARNMALNDLADSIRLCSTPLWDIKERFSLVVANLTLDTIMELMPVLSRVVEPGGRLIVSGLLREQVHQVAEKLAHQGFQDIETRFEEEWACLTARKKEWGDKKKTEDSRQ
jgi:ribosomal protein L11 methyltransferase